MLSGCQSPKNRFVALRKATNLFRIWYSRGRASLQAEHHTTVWLC